MDLWRFLSESLVCPWQSHQKRVSPLMPLPLSAAVWLLAPSFPFSIQCLCICMIASVETAKWKLWRKSTRLRPNPLGSLLDNISQVYPPFFPEPMNTMCLYRCLNMLMIGHGGLRPLLHSFTPHTEIQKKFLKFCKHKDALKFFYSPCKLFLNMPGSRWFIAL